MHHSRLPKRMHSASIKKLIQAICNTLAIGTGGIGLLAATAVQAVELLAEEKSFDIPVQPIAAALMQFSRQANVQVIADAGKLGNARSQSLNGRFKPAEGISILLSRTGLLYEVTASNTVVIGNQRPNAGNGSRLALLNADGGRMWLAQSTQAGIEPGPSAGTNAPANPEPIPSSDNAAPLEEISVTATRIQRDGFNAPTPTTIVGIDEIQARSAVNVSSVLYEMPAVRAAASATVATQNQGGNFVSLRGLGPTRTLTLVDGRRFCPHYQYRYRGYQCDPLRIGRAHRGRYRRRVCRMGVGCRFWRGQSCPQETDRRVRGRYAVRPVATRR